MARVLARCALACASSTAVLALAALVASAAPASAGPISGGCTGTVNGVDATPLTSDDPLVVHDDEQLLVQGNVPQPFANANAVSNTTIKMWIVDDVAGITGDREPSTGATYSANDVNLDDYRRFGVGLYRVEIENVGPFWKCLYSAYIELDGGALSKTAGWVALGAVVVAAVGVLYAKGRKPRYPGWIDGGLGTSDQIAREEAWQAAGQRYPDALDYTERGEHGWRPPSTIAPNEEVIWSGTLRLHGHPVAGALWGFLFGLGVGVLGWQDAQWTVNRGSIVILPIVAAVVCGLLAWFGWGYRIRDVVVLPRQPEPAPAPAGPPPVQTGPYESAPDDTAAIETPSEPTSGEVGAP